MIIVVNFKTYPSATGENALKLAKICEEVSNKTENEIFIAVQPTDILRMKDMQVISQHVDNLEQGRNTGFILPESIKEAGAIGSLINHSEHKLNLDDINETINRCKGLDLKTFVCAASVEEARKIARFDPNYIAFEDPNLISTGIPISKANPQSVKDFVLAVKSVNPRIITLCGAGISTGDDVRSALELGCDGVLAASAITKSDNPKKVLMDFINQ